MRLRLSLIHTCRSYSMNQNALLPARNALYIVTHIYVDFFVCPSIHVIHNDVYVSTTISILIGKTNCCKCIESSKIACSCRLPSREGTFTSHEQELYVRYLDHWKKTTHPCKRNTLSPYFVNKKYVRVNLRYWLDMHDRQSAKEVINLCLSYVLCLLFLSRK